MTSWPTFPALSSLAYPSAFEIIGRSPAPGCCISALFLSILPTHFVPLDIPIASVSLIHGCWQQMSHLESTFTLRWCRLSWVGRMFEHALQIKFLTFGGTFRSQIVFHTLPSIQASESSAPSWCIRWRATWYAVLTGNLLALFSFHTNSSLLCIAFKGIAKISHPVLGANNSCTFYLFHWPVSSSMSSLTSIVGWSSPMNTGLCGSQLSTATLIFLPSPTFHCDPTFIMSLVANGLRQTYEGLCPN